MKKTRRTTEQIIRILRAAEGGGQTTEEICREHNISAQTYYRWKNKYGGMNLKEAQRLRDIEKENTASSPPVERQIANPKKPNSRTKVE